MALWKISEIKNVLKNTINSSTKDNTQINKIVIDSRSRVENGLFVAILGENNDGHNYLSQAFENGCIVALVEKIPSGFENDPRLLLVENSTQALNQLAIAARARTKAKIIALTGSVGKTSVKEMLKTVFKSQGKTYATLGNLNNHFGLPLSLANMEADCEFGIFEIGMNHSGEIKPLSQIVKPHIAIITNVYAAHIGNFHNEEEIALEKSEIFSGLEEGGFAVINGDNKHYNLIKNQALSNKIPEQNIINFGSKEISNVRLLTIEKSADRNSKVSVFIDNSKTTINYLTNTINQATIFNSLIAIACLNLLIKNFIKNSNIILENLNHLETPNGRGNLIEVQKGDICFTIINDSYNANSASMISGLKYLSDLGNVHKNTKENTNKVTRKIAFIGDMLELGESSINEHKAIANYITIYNIDKVLLVGDLMHNLIDDINPEKLIGHFPNSLIAAQNIKWKPQNGDIIFVKGSRGTKMENLIEKIINE